jgi:hypothetical protein
VNYVLLHTLFLKEKKAGKSRPCLNYLLERAGAAISG